MFNQKTLDTLSFCGAVKYHSKQNYTCDYSTTPRPCHNIAFMLEGEGTIISGDTVLYVKKGDILYIPQNSTYISKWTAKPNCVFHSVHFNFTPTQNPFNTKRVPVQLLPNDEFEKLYTAVQTIQAYQYEKTPHSFLYLSAFYFLCGTLLPHAKTKDEVFLQSNIAPALLYLENHSTQSCTIAQLANLCYLSPSRFFYLFKKQVGCSPITYKNKITIQKTTQTLLLYKDKSIDHIAREYGFESTIYFTRLFKKVIGKTPSQFRKDETLM